MSLRKSTFSEPRSHPLLDENSRPSPCRQPPTAFDNGVKVIDGRRVVERVALIWPQLLALLQKGKEHPLVEKIRRAPLGGKG